MIIEVLRICRREINFLLLAPKESSLDCAQPSTYRVIPRFRKKTSRDLQINSFLLQHGVFSLLSPRPLSFTVIPASEPVSRLILIP